MKVEFLTSCVLEVVGSSQWRLASNFIAKADVLIVVPTGFETDLASVPRLPATYLLFGGRGRKSSVLHDYLYSRQAGKEYADQVFRGALRAEEGAITAWFMWAAVHFAGGIAYERHADKQEQP